MKMEHIVPLLNVEDVARSIEFYTTRLGFNVDNSWTPEDKVAWARISNGPVGLMLNHRGGDEHAHRRARKGYQDVVIYIGVADVDALHASLTEAGLSPGVLEDQMYGVREFSVRDPDGYDLALTSPLEQDQA